MVLSLIFSESCYYFPQNTITRIFRLLFPSENLRRSPQGENLKNLPKLPQRIPQNKEDYCRETKGDDQVFPCPKEGCTRSFQRHCSLEKHLAFGTCTQTVEKETLLDKAKVKYAARLEEGSSSVPTIPLPPETCPRNTGYVTPPEGFALKQVKKAYRFNENQREYLTARFIPSDKKAARRSTRKLLQQK